MYIHFFSANSQKNHFINRSFDEIHKDISIESDSSIITYLSEQAFKPVLNNKRNQIVFDYGIEWNSPSTIHCNHCKNYWLIKEKKQNYIKNTHCKGDN